MLFEKSVWRRRVLGQHGVSREMMGKDLQVCLGSLPGEGWISHLPWAAGGSGPSPASPGSSQKQNQFLLAKNIDNFNRRSL